MIQNQSRGLKFFEIALLVLIFIFAIRPVENYDIWFHLKYGEYIVKTHSLPFSDVFSHSAYGTPAIPYEWLFQVFIYLVYHAFGSIGVQAVVVSLTFSYILLFRKILIKFFNLGVLSRMTLVSLLYLLGYNFWVERPQLAAFLLFMVTLYIVMDRIYFGKRKLLWFTPAIFIIWTNLHASMITGLYLFFVPGVFFLLRFLKEHQSSDKGLTRDLLGFGFIGFLATILPPLGTKVYQLLYIFFIKRDFISKAIDEWIPLYQESIRYDIYLAIFALAAVAVLYAFIKKYRRDQLLFFLTFLPLGLFVFTAVRQTPFTLPVTFFLFIPALQMIKLPIHQIGKYILAVIIVGLSYLGMSAYYALATGLAKDYPVHAISFIKQNIKGNMFNEYNTGGYLMYTLGPDIKTFIDGRTDMFLPKVLPEYIYFSSLSYTDDDVYLGVFNKLVSMYHISWTILANNRYSLSWRLGRILGNDKSWYLVYFDDASKIYVEDDGLNKEVIDKYAMKAVTPLGKTLYRKGEREQAFAEYKKMYTSVKSAVAANAVGYMLLEDKKYDEAKRYFIEALALDPTASAPKMNLAELAAKDGNYKEAISLYRQAVKNDPNRGLAYLRLGQLILEAGGSANEARSIWKKGLASSTDQDIINQLKKALGENN